MLHYYQERALHFYSYKFLFQFLTSHKQRAKDSATVFYQTVFHENPENELPVVKTSDDRLYVSIRDASH